MTTIFVYYTIQSWMLFSKLTPETKHTWFLILRRENISYCRSRFLFSNQIRFNTAFPFVFVHFFFLKLKSQSNSTGPAVSKTNTSIIVSRDKRLDTNDYTRRAIDHLKQASRSNGIMLLWAAPCHWQAYDLKRISESIAGQQLRSSQSRGPDFLTTVARKKDKPQLKCGALFYLWRGKNIKR